MTRLLSLALLLLLAVPLGAQSKVKDASATKADSPAQRVETAVMDGVTLLLDMQEGDNRAEWPYEGVYRVREVGNPRGAIPIGYRVGGTGIVGMALLHAPDLDRDADRRAAVRRALEFVLASTAHELMTPDYDGGYDVRGWGYCYGLMFLLQLKSAGQVPAELAADTEKAVKFYLAALQQIEIPTLGGWNYAREGIDVPSRGSPFMTAPCLQVLFDAQSQGYSVDEGIIQRGLAFLERTRNDAGGITYSLGKGKAGNDGVPGAVGRMCAVEATLALAGRNTPAQVRGAVDAFLVHWEWLEKRRAQTGTHVKPYGVAPYYFYFAHYYAAQAIELLPEHEREEYRRRLRDRLWQTQGDDGSWNDRVFERSANYGTAMSTMALRMAEMPAPASWQATAE